jgi:hypothetical protein
LRKPQYQGNAKYLEHAAAFEVSEEFLRSMAAGDAAIFYTDNVSNKDGVALCNAVGAPSGAGQPVFRLLALPVVSDGAVVGVVITGVSTHTISGQDSETFALGRVAIASIADDLYFTYTKVTNLMIVDPVFRQRDAQVEPNAVFVLMPFGEERSTRIWERFIRPVCAAEGLDASRADDLYGADIMEDVWAGICRARVVIADITKRNPNVFYELGIAHTIGKEVILLTQNINDIPFDLNRYRHIVYADNMDGYDKLKASLRATLRDILSR